MDSYNVRFIDAFDFVKGHYSVVLLIQFVDYLKWRLLKEGFTQQWIKARFELKKIQQVCQLIILFKANSYS